MKKSVFVSTFDSIEKEIPFTFDWANGTGYFDGLVHADLGLVPGEVVKTVAGGEDKRRIIIVATRHGNVAVFERYTPNLEDESENLVVVSNAPRGFSSLRLVKDGAMSTDHFEEVVGVYCSNIGERIEVLAKMAAAA